MTRIILHYSIQNGGDGSAYLAWFLTAEQAEADQADMDEGWGDPCMGSVETFEGSNIHKEALANENLVVSLRGQVP